MGEKCATIGISLSIGMGQHNVPSHPTQEPKNVAISMGFHGMPQQGRMAAVNFCGCTAWKFKPEE